MDEKNSLTATEQNAERKSSVAPPVHKAVKKKSTIVKLVLIGIAMVIGIILAFVPMRFGLTLYHPFLSEESISLGLDLQGGVYAVYQATNTDTSNFDAKMEGTRSSLESLLASKGYTEATIVREGTDRIRVEVPDVDDPSGILQVIGEPTTVRFVLDSTNETIITGDNIVNADSGYDETSGYVVSLEFDAEGRRKFAEVTANNQGSTISIYLGDSTTPIQTANINETIPNGRAMISGNFTAESAQELGGRL